MSGVQWMAKPSPWASQEGIAKYYRSEKANAEGRVRGIIKTVQIFMNKLIKMLTFYQRSAILKKFSKKWPVGQAV